MSGSATTYSNATIPVATRVMMIVTRCLSQWKRWFGLYSARRRATLHDVAPILACLPSVLMELYVESLVVASCLCWQPKQHTYTFLGLHSVLSQHSDTRRSDCEIQVIKDMACSPGVCEASHQRDRCLVVVSLLPPSRDV